MYKYHIDYQTIESPQTFGETVFFQLGRLWFFPSGSVKKHAHGNLFELTVVTDGEGVLVTNDVPTPVSKGDIYLSYPGDFHEIRSSGSEGMKYDFFAFNTKNECLAEELRAIVSVCGYDKRLFRSPQVAAAVSSAIAEYPSKEKHRVEVLAHLFELIIFYIVRGFSTDKSHEGRSAASSDELCYQLMHYIDTNIYTIEKLSELATVFRYNYSYLSDVFRRTTGNTLNEYYHARRLDTAALLVAEKRLKMSRIAEMLKYSSLYSFSKAFKKRFGTSPKNYRG